jgi:signal transduction histidine kinase
MVSKPPTPWAQRVFNRLGLDVDKHWWMGIKVVVAGSLEDHAVLQYALATSMPDSQIEVGTDGYRAVELARRAHPDLIVADPAVRGGLSGFELISKLKEAAPSSPVLCWTARGDVDEATELLRAGASAYLLKDDGPTDLVRQIPAVLEGGLVIAPKVATGLAAKFTHSIHRESELTRALAETTMQLQEIASSKEAFMANVNHELRTPVTIVKGIAHLLKSGQLSQEDQEQFVKRMDVAVEKLTSIVEEVLSVSDAGNGRISLEPREADMVELLHQACDRVQASYPDITIDRQAMGTFRVWVDPERICEVMTQLLDNACRYSPAGGRVVVALRRVAEGVMFSVTDSGEGLPRDVLQKAFREPFVTGEEILRKERAGLGLGLHLARQLVVLHGGIMWADPLPSGGTRVAFCIPEHSPLFMTPPPPAPTTVATADVTPATPGGTQGEADVSSLLQQLLQD